MSTVRGAARAARASALLRAAVTARTAAVIESRRAGRRSRARQTTRRRPRAAPARRRRPTAPPAGGACVPARANVASGDYDPRPNPSSAGRPARRADAQEGKRGPERRGGWFGFASPLGQRPAAPPRASAGGSAESRARRLAAVAAAAGQAPAYLLGIRTVSRFRPFLRRRLRV